MYDFVFTFELLHCSEEQKRNLEAELIEMKINFTVFEISTGYRFITVGATRRRVENIVADYNGRHIRMLDDYTFKIMCDLMEVIEEVKEE